MGYRRKTNKAYLLASISLFLNIIIIIYLMLTR